jgi:hypothetical protein
MVGFNADAPSRAACVDAVGLRYFESVLVLFGFAAARIAFYPIWVWRRPRSVNSDLLAV